MGEIHEAANGQEGLQVLEHHWIDLALVDMNMPVMNGEEMLDRVRQNPETSDLPVVVISTQGSDTRIDTLRRKGVGFVHKPFTPEILRETILGITGGSDEQQSGEGTLQSSPSNF